MATQIASGPPSVAAPPFLLAPPQVDDHDRICKAALTAAATAERADMTRRNTRGRIAYLLCEFGYQLARQGIDASAFLVDRRDIAEALGVSLCRVKRTLALLSLSGVVECDDGSARVLDWPRLCAIADYEASRLDIDEDEQVPELACIAEADEELPSLVTRAGDPACFV